MRHVPRHLGRVGNRAAAVIGDLFRPVGTQDLAAQAQGSAVQFRQPGNRRLAGPVERGKESALGGKALAGFDVMNCLEQGGGVGVVGAPLDPDRTLCNGGQHVIGRNGATCHMGHAQTVQTGLCQKCGRGHTIRQLLETRLHIAAEFHDFQMREGIQQLRPAAQGGRADPRALGQVLERGRILRDEGIAHILARQVGVQQQACRLQNRHVLHRMHRNVDGAIQQRLFDFAGEQPLAADLLERAILDRIAGDLYDHDGKSLFRQVKRRHEARARLMRLGQSQRRATGADLQR